VFEKLIELDKKALIYLNGLGTEQWDSFWLFVTKQHNWIPLFVLLLFLIFKYLGWKKGVFILFFLAILIAFSDQFTNMIRRIFERLRPNNDPEISNALRTFIRPQSFSFTSGHATTSTAVTVFIIFLLKKHFKYILWLVIFPIVFAYSRLYLGVHFPIDIFTGACIGTLIGVTFYKLFFFLEKKYFNN